MTHRLAITVVLLAACGAESSRSTVDVGDQPAPEAEEGALIGITQAHNTYRTGVGVSDLVWDAQVAHAAEKWAQILASHHGCELVHGQADKGVVYGQNLFLSAPAEPLEEADFVVGAWAGEEPDYDYATDTCADGKQCGHWTQIVWSGSERIGCAMRTCAEEDVQVWVCNYDPPGNVVGVKPF